MARFGACRLGKVILERFVRHQHLVAKIDQFRLREVLAVFGHLEASTVDGDAHVIVLAETSPEQELRLSSGYF